MPVVRMDLSNGWTGEWLATQTRRRKEKKGTVCEDVAENRERGIG
jgi:hypothetical protein